MLDPKRIKSKKLRGLFAKGKETGVSPELLDKVKRILNALDVMVSPSELNLPGYGWHKLQGDRADTFSVRVNRNWRITYKWDSDGPYDVDYEDYHGK